jgi:anthraniloyl-CoA monooxygenase
VTRPLKINVVGGGPGGLYFSILMKLADPAHQITVFERNRADDTFGFAVVFSDETLGNFMGQDPATYEAITEAFGYWDEIEVRYRDRRIRSGGHGFCGISRIELLNILQRRALELGVVIHFETDITEFEALRDSDLVLGSDGANSLVRETYAGHFKPSIDFRQTKFAWLGTTQVFDAFTFVFRENEHGWHYLHAYRMGRNQFGDQGSTWILECHEDTWRNAGFDNMSEQDTVAYYAEMFEQELDGHPLLSNQTNWRNFPVVTNQHWSFENVVLMGDAAHTAQFSIGSGTKIAMEGAIALADALTENDEVPGALAAYEEARRDEIAALQRTALVSLGWYENARRYNAFNPDQYAFSFLSRSKSITYDNLRLRDETYGAAVDHWFAEIVRAEQGLDVPKDNPPPPMFTPFRIGEMLVQNRVVVSPMCQYMAEDGLVNDWHLVHLGGLAVGGAGLVFTEMTDVSAEARISPGCAGIYRDGHTPAWRRIVDFMHGQSAARVCMQLAHAGRKGSTKLAWEGDNEALTEGGWEILSASPIPYFADGKVPREMDRADMDKVIADFTAAAGRADAAGFDMIEVHMAHGYLLACFLSPLTNRRADEYGGSPENRLRFPLQVLDAVRTAWPGHKPISVRISATDWVEDGGLTGDEAVAIAASLKDHGAAIINVSAGQTTTDADPIYGRMFQVPFAEQIRLEAGVPTIAAGNITSADQINTILAAGRADLCALARPHLADPHFTLRAAAHYGYTPQLWPNPYLAAKTQSERMAEQERSRGQELLIANKPQSHKPSHKKAAE